MLIGYEMFLLAAEELNFSRAAERAFVTPQCLSDHIITSRCFAVVLTWN